MNTLMIIWHSRTLASKQAANCAYQGALHVQRELQQNHSILFIPAENVQAQQLLQANAYLFCAPENLGSLSGIMKEFFDRHYYTALGKIEGRPYSAIISAGTDGQGALTQLKRICTGWRLNEQIPSQIFSFRAETEKDILTLKTLTEQQQQIAWEMGATLYALISD
ncbi:flavodoxin [Pelistega indica]|uniref:Flavodoxin n=1 Tax=Pelistega indica TaxID=1414851 RepID=V8G3G5_9BURK|nr:MULTISPECIES: NAD(P)H-dependent oxidoreductase [Pelistega]ETD70960.1 flavodoxin [Pelistega indica]